MIVPAGADAEPVSVPFDGAPIEVSRVYPDVVSKFVKNAVGSAEKTHVTVNVLSGAPESMAFDHASGEQV